MERTANSGRYGSVGRCKVGVGAAWNGQAMLAPVRWGLVRNRPKGRRGWIWFDALRYCSVGMGVVRLGTGYLIVVGAVW